MTTDHTKGLGKTVATSREEYYGFSAKASEIVRQLALAGVALIWVFRIDRSSGVDALHPGLRVPAVLIIGSLACDLLQYVYGAAAWGIFTRLKEKAVQDGREKEPFWAPSLMNVPTVVFFYSKIALMVLAYVLVGRFLVTRVM